MSSLPGAHIVPVTTRMNHNHADISCSIHGLNATLTLKDMPGQSACHRNGRLTDRLAVLYPYSPANNVPSCQIAYLVQGHLPEVALVRAGDY